ncbi:Uncharacterised protein [Edwardsiella tarda]|nr:Uncharacterised protein [Edwardsiella tarda]
MTTTTKGAIDVDTVTAQIKACYRLIKQHGLVLKIFRHDYNDKSCKRSESISVADCSASISSLTC